MSNQDKHIIPWSNSDIRKYLGGELSPREMHQLEKAALEDPFLADAIEGLSLRAGAPLEDDLQQLDTRLTDRVSEKRKQTIFMPWMKMAAAIAVLAGICFTAWFTLLDHSNTKLAIAPHRADTTKPDLPISTFATPKPTAATPTPNTASSRPNFASAPPNIASTRKTKAPSHRTRQATLPAVTIAGAEKSTVDSTKNILKSLPALDIAQSNRAADSNLVLAGKVLDRNNHPLAGATLLVSGPANANATTNALGQFKLSLRPQDTSERLTVAMAGYQMASLPLNTLNTDDATNNTIFLRENPNALSEVVVSGMGKNRKETFAAVPSEDKNERLDAAWIKNTPVTGRQAYLLYLETAKKTLPVDSTIQGTEIVSFTIDPKGIPADFKIEHSLSPAHDAGVIRLIIEGARWKAIHGKNIRAMVSLSFP